MNKLTLKHGSFRVVRKVIGIINVLVAILWLIAHSDHLRIFDWLYFVVFAVGGLTLLTNGFGTESSFLLADEGTLSIKWMNRIRKRVFIDSDISKITLARFNIIIIMKDKTENKFNIDFLERDQKKELYNFFIEYSKIRNIELGREFRAS